MDFLLFKEINRTSQDDAVAACDDVDRYICHSDNHFNGEKSEVEMRPLEKRSTCIQSL